MDRVYLDHAATTPLDPHVLEAMLPYLSEAWGNPSSLYAEAQEARRGLESARRTIAEILACRPQDIVVTSGGSEADNLALRGAAHAARAQGRGNHVITTAIEHHAVLHAAERLEQEGFRVTYLGVDREGFIDLAELDEAVTDETVLVSIMYVNNEVGTIERIADAARIVKAKNPRTAVHTDAVQAAGSLDINVDRLGVDLLSISAHKFYGPKGVGALYVRPRTAMQWQMLGGSQEKNRRAGTENVPGVVGMATALDLAYADLEARNAHTTALRDRLIAGIPDRIPGVHLTGPTAALPSPGGRGMSGEDGLGEGTTPRPAHPEALVGRADHGHPDPPNTAHPEALEGRAPNNASFCFEGIEGEAILIALDLAGVAASSGSACTSGSLEPSHVLTAMGIAEDLARGSMRLTVGKDNTVEQIDYVLEVLPDVVSRIRGLSPTAAERQEV